jgi:hypothetical protein
MVPTCTGCGDEIGGADVRYTRQRPDGADAHFCSPNCVADTDRFDGDDVRARLEEPTAPRG